MTPSSGSMTGGTSVTITGTDFVNLATVTFGGSAATGVTFVSSTSITATTPYHDGGAVDVVVTNPDTQSGTLVGGFTFIAPNTPPTASITSPANVSTFFSTSSTAFTGAGTDTEDGALTGASLVWTSSVDGQIGTGASFTGFLTAGSHTITLTVTDSQGASGSASVGVTALVPVIPAMSTWGLIAAALLVLAGMVYFGLRRRSEPG